jgi:hypothetical protein
MLPCATQDFRNAVAEFDYVFSRIPRNSVPVRPMGGPPCQPLSLIACELFADGRGAPQPAVLKRSRDSNSNLEEYNLLLHGRSLHDQHKQRLCRRPLPGRCHS